MSYIIIEVHIVYKENKISELAVLWQSNERGWIRASYFTTKHWAGYGYLLPTDILSPALIQKVAGQGANLPDEKKELYFPGKKHWER
jgi:hypothetical protein